MTAATFSHSCETKLRELWDAQGVEVHISTAPPMVAGPYTTDGMRCPHGITYWWEPTGEQIAAWVRDGVQ
ncbi:hypothetical protein P3T35_003047 [Kitasatospora sp. GP30]|uniref:hypothetical protein n=1 Tax=Kitasatospora sp. GP30 TaxID=3035084 RepID=UPI000C6FF71F|nr:hypothetical protein [Kitasatospora sp. GP30]MDH6141034.1 hypothetical protein [Kitasatospora sp. GP30]